MGIRQSFGICREIFMIVVYKLSILNIITVHAKKINIKLLPWLPSFWSHLGPVHGISQPPAHIPSVLLQGVPPRHCPQILVQFSP